MDFGGERLQTPVPIATLPLISRVMSFAAPDVDFDSDSDFAAAYRRDPIFALTVADELIDTLSVTNPAIYRSVIRKLQK